MIWSVHYVNFYHFSMPPLPAGSSEDVHLAADSMIETAIDGEDSLEKQIHRIIEAYLQGANSEPG